MDMGEIKAEILALPSTAVTAPILTALWEQVEALQNNRARMVQGDHISGLCSEPTCQACVSQRQALGEAGRLMGRRAVLHELDTALLVAGGAKLRDDVATVVQRWVMAGKPEPVPESPEVVGLHITGS